MGIWGESEREKNDREYAEGDRAGREGDWGTDFLHDSSDKSPRGKGYAYGTSHRHDGGKGLFENRESSSSSSLKSRSSGGSSSSSSSDSSSSGSSSYGHSQGNSGSESGVAAGIGCLVVLGVLGALGYGAVKGFKAIDEVVSRKEKERQQRIFESVRNSNELFSSRVRPDVPQPPVYQESNNSNYIRHLQNTSFFPKRVENLEEAAAPVQDYDWGGVKEIKYDLGSSQTDLVRILRMDGSIFCENPVLKLENFQGFNFEIQSPDAFVIEEVDLDLGGRVIFRTNIPEGYGTILVSEDEPTAPTLQRGRGISETNDEIWRRRNEWSRRNGGRIRRR